MEKVLREERKHPRFRPEPTVADLMSTDLFYVNENDNLNLIDDFMKWLRVRHIPVVNDDGLVGLVTQRDYLRAYASNFATNSESEAKKKNSELRVSKIMQRNIQTVSPMMPLHEAATIMFTNKFGCLPVEDEGELVGIITESDFVKAFFKYDIALD